MNARAQRELLHTWFIFSHRKTSSGTHWSNRWTYPIFIMNTRCDQIIVCSHARCLVLRCAKREIPFVSGCSVSPTETGVRPGSRLGSPRPRSRRNRRGNRRCTCTLWRSCSPGSKSTFQNATFRAKNVPRYKFYILALTFGAFLVPISRINIQCRRENRRGSRRCTCTPWRSCSPGPKSTF